MTIRGLIVALSLVAASTVYPAGFAGVAYGTDPQQQLDIYLPDALPAPVVLLLHGGGWTVGDKCAAADGDCLFPSPILRHVRAHFVANGFVVVVPNFRAAPNPVAGQPGRPFPAAVDDIADVLAWIAGPGGRAAGCLPQIAIVGESSGANLGAMAAVAGDAPVVAFVGYGGIYDFSLRRGATGGPSDTEAINYRVEQYLGCVPSQCMTTAMAASPYWRIERDVPLYLVHGELDPLAPSEHSVRMHEGTPGSRLLIVAGAPHGGAAFTSAAIAGDVYPWIEAQLRQPSRSPRPPR